MKRLLLIILSIFLISACTMPETKIYSIYLPDSPPTTISKGVTGGFSSEETSLVILITSPRYLSQAYIAYRNSPYQLEISRYSKWELPPSDLVREALRNYLSSTGNFKEVRVSSVIQDGFYSIEINLKKFERFDEGNNSFGELVYDVKLLSPDSKELYHSTISKRVKLVDQSFLSLAKGLSTALSEGMKELTEGIVAQCKNK